MSVSIAQGVRPWHGRPTRMRCRCWPPRSTDASLLIAAAVLAATTAASVLLRTHATTTKEWS